jgi:hypothetical protein
LYGASPNFRHLSHVSVFGRVHDGCCGACRLSVHQLDLPWAREGRTTNSGQWVVDISYGLYCAAGVLQAFGGGPEAGIVLLT